MSAEPDSADVEAVADHVDHIASVTGRAQYVVSHHTPFPSISSHTDVLQRWHWERLRRHRQLPYRTRGRLDLPRTRASFSLFSSVVRSRYPETSKIAELYSRGWSANELRGFAGGNFLRVFAAAEGVAREMAREGVLPAQDLHEKRTDIPKELLGLQAPVLTA